MLPPFKHPVSSCYTTLPLIGSESIPPLEANNAMHSPRPSSTTKKSAAKVQIEGVYPSVSHGQGRTPDFDNPSVSHGQCRTLDFDNARYQRATGQRL